MKARRFNGFRFVAIMIGTVGTVGMAVVAVAGCGDEASGPSATGGCQTNDDCAGTTVCVESVCQAGPGDAAWDTTQSDTEDPPSDTVTPGDTGKPVGEDVPKPFDPGPVPDLLPDETPPDVKTFTPADGTMNVPVPFTITVSFTEPVQNVGKNSIELTDVSGNVVEATYGKEDANGTIWKVTPQDPLLLASPYQVAVNFPHQVIKDSAGNKMEGFKEYIFFTAGPKDMGGYESLAKEYAPVVRLTTVSAAKAYLDIPTAVDLDKNWDIKDNIENLKLAKEIVPTVYYSVLESESHLFVHYTFFWSRRENGTQNEYFDSDASGSLLVLEKWPEVRPVSIMPWFKLKGGEYVRSYVTAEGGILAGGDKSNAGIDAVYTQTELFPENRYQAYLSKERHESCLWTDPGNDETCDLNAGDKPTNPLKLLPGGDGSKIVKVGGKWVLDGDHTYKLVPSISSWWPRRTRYATMFHNSATTYTAPSEKDATVAKFPKFFLDAEGEESDGRVPWAVKWEPGDLGQFTEIAQGAFFFDPPRFLAERHKTDYVKAAYEPEAKKGFSRTFCFNPYLGIDRRGTTDACPK